jgi:hypothetical protein
MEESNLPSLSVKATGHIQKFSKGFGLKLKMLLLLSGEACSNREICF